MKFNFFTILFIKYIVFGVLSLSHPLPTKLQTSGVTSPLNHRSRVLETTTGREIQTPKARPSPSAQHRIAIL